MEAAAVERANYLSALGLCAQAPSNAALSAKALTLERFNQIRDAGGGGYQGWAIDKYEDSIMAWTGRNSSNFAAVAALLNNFFGELNRDIDDDHCNAYGNRHYLELHIQSSSEDGLSVAGGTMIFYKW